MTEGTGPAPGPDGRPRCPWALGAVDYLGYHDLEWGRPVTDDAGIFERLSLEGFQSGLSWLTILRKRENFRVAFSRFDLAAVAGFGAADEERLLADPGIVRNRAKVRAVLANAKAAGRRPPRPRTCPRRPRHRARARASFGGWASVLSAR